MIREVALFAMTVSVVAGCATPSDPPPTQGASSAVSASPSTSNPSTSLRIDVTIAGSTITPSGARYETKVNQPIELHVTSDVSDQLHVHAIPEQTFDVKPPGPQSFRFTVEVPGRVEVELHQLGRTVATILVQP